MLHPPETTICCRLKYMPSLMTKIKNFCTRLAEPGESARGDSAGQKLIATKVILQQNAGVVAIVGRVQAAAVLVGRVQVAATTTAIVLEKVVGGNLGGKTK